MMNMLKRGFALVLALTMVLGLAACGIEAPKQEQPGDTTATTAPEAVQDNGGEAEQTPAQDSDLSETKPAEDAVASQEKPADKETSSEKPEETKPAEKPEEETPSQETPEQAPDSGDTVAAPQGQYNEGIVLVKSKTAPEVAAYSKYGFKSAKPLYAGSSWYCVELQDKAATVNTVSQLRKDGCFEQVDYDYIMATDDYAEVTENPDFSKQKGLDTHGVKKFWDHSNGNKKQPGGSPDVVIAVIDTGIDYNHLDLRNNVWVNPAEIPENGIDDDNNGYIDDVYGWDCVGNDNDPMDDNGHGTHVAGIIAAENNKEGIVGVAFNCRVMAVKAGNSSGYFNNSDIAEAIQYAYMNGASVINMSFGGSFISIAVEEALENAYNSCVLVAAAGNDGKCNDLKCKTCDRLGVSYPAALPYVIGVMSCGYDGKTLSSFSNYDHDPYNEIEYEVYGCGESIPSCWPGNKYATLNGTSMAAPMISGLAALLRSELTDRNMYSTKYIQSQIVNTGKVHAYNALLEEIDDAHSVADAYEALTNVPKPAVKLYDYHIDDSASIHENNNGNGIIDAGETVRLYVALHNRGGVASNVQVTADVIRGEGVVDPYFTFVNSTMELSDIGTYSVRESGDKYFEILVSPDCPNDYLTVFNIRFTYENGLDTSDETVYAEKGEAEFNISSGYHLPAVINEDTVYPADRLYIVGENVLIADGVTVTFEPGARIQFYADKSYYDSPAIKVYGTLKLEGTAEKMITINPSERYANCACIIYDYGTTTIDYVDAVNLFASGVETVSNSYLRHSGTQTYYLNDAKTDGTYSLPDHGATTWTDNYIELISYATQISATEMTGNYIVIASANTCIINCTTFTDNIVYSVVKGDIKVTDRMNQFYGKVSNNQFLVQDNENPASMMGLSFGSKQQVTDNYFAPGYIAYADQIITGYYDPNGNETVELSSQCSNISALYPHIVSIELFNKDGEAVNTIGKEEISVKVTFNRPMDQSKDPNVTFGTIEPYADYKIEGQWTDELVWEGTYTLKAQIENGQNYLKVKGARDAVDPTKVVLGDYQKHEFTIDTTAAMAMNLIATATDAGIELTWAQDDYDTLMGYNIYRSTAKDGNFVKINPTVLTAGESSFVDTNAEPGVTYWYTFTVVLSDFTESAPAGKVYCTAVDTVLPTVYHTPVNQGYLNNNLVISCTASDNMKVASVVLYYRTAGTETWKSLEMLKVNDKYSATVFGSELTLDGLEYYLVASDTGNSVSKGTAEEPYFVVIKDASVISRKGDVDGDGTVTVKDAQMLIMCINGDLIMSDDAFKRADLNGDSVLSSVEALRILQYINGNVPDLNM